MAPRPSQNNPAPTPASGGSADEEIVSSVSLPELPFTLSDIPEGAWYVGTHLLLPFLCFVVAYWVGFTLLMRLKTKQNHIRKVWQFLLFFLSKRHMSLPLIYTLAKQDDLLEEDTLRKLLDIRTACRTKPLHKHPTERMQMEAELSNILLDYFQRLDKSGNVRTGTKLEHVMRDLEFVDGKLLELQQMYNHEVTFWNKKVNRPIIKYIYWILDFPPFESFALEKVPMGSALKA